MMTPVRDGVNEIQQSSLSYEKMITLLAISVTSFSNLANQSKLTTYISKSHIALRKYRENNLFKKREQESKGKKISQSSLFFQKSITAVL